MFQNLQTPIIPLLQAVADRMARVPEKAKNALFYASGLAYFALYFLGESGLVQWRYLYVFACSCLCFALMALTTFPDTVRPVKFRPAITVCWLLYGLFALQAGVRLNTDFLPGAALTLFAFPLLYLVWNNGDWRDIADKLCRLVVLSLPLCLAVSLLFFPMDSEAYSSLFDNQNAAGDYYALALSCLGVSLLAERRQLHFFFKMLIFGMAAALLFYSGSRTGQLGAVCALSVAALIRFIGVRREAKSEVVGKVLAMLLSLIVFLFATFFLFRGGYLLKENMVHTLRGESTATDEDWQEAMDLKDLQAFFDRAKYKYGADGKDLSDYSTGRTDIWMAFITKLNLFGHAQRAEVPYTNDRTTTDPHNTPITVAFDYGIGGGLFYLAVNLLSGLLVLLFAWKHRGEPWVLFSVAAIVSFGAVSMLSFAEYAHHANAMYYRLAMFPLFAANWQTKEDT